MKLASSRGYRHGNVIFASLCAAMLAWPVTTHADEPAATQSASVTANPEQSSSQDNPAHAWLDKIDTAGKSLKSLHGQLRYEVIQGALGDKQVRVGSLFYDAKKPAKFAVHFDRLLAGKRLLREDRWYIFDGRWMVEKMGSQKQFIKREMTDPASKEADNANPLTDGQGPFALPITLQKEQVLKKYKVELLDVEKDATNVAGDNAADAQTIKLRLTPHVAQRGDFTQIELTYDTTTMLPVRVDTLDETENETSVILSKVKIDQPIEPVVFDTTPPKSEDGWTVEIKPWGK